MTHDNRRAAQPEHVAQLVKEFELSTRPVEEALTVPPACYTDGEFFAFERDAVFRDSWLYVCHQSELPAVGDHYAVTIAGEPIVLTRDASGINALSAVCRHRSFPILEETKGNGKFLRCPYHFWTYGLDGKLIGAPDMGAGRDIRALDICLPRYEVDVWHGFVFVHFGTPQGPLGPTVQKLDAELATYRTEDLVAARSVTLRSLPWNWKNMLENALEEYHTSYVHKGYHEAAPARLVEHVPFDETSENAILRYANFVDPERGFLTEDGRDPFPQLTGLTPSQRGRVLYTSVPPTLFGSIKRDSAMIFRILPETVGTMTLTATWLFPPSTIELPEFDAAMERLVGFFEVVNGQDMAANERVYRGLRSPAASRGPYSPQEESLVQLNRWLLRHYNAHLSSV